MKFFITPVLLLLFIGTSCCTSSKTSKGDAMNGTTETSENTKKMIAEGFTKGTIVASTAEEDCPFVISSTIDGNEMMYDPINLENNYKKNGMNVWYKYNGLRMMNRCEKASPVNITEIKEIE